MVDVTTIHMTLHVPGQPGARADRWVPEEKINETLPVPGGGGGWPHCANRRRIHFGVIHRPSPDASIRAAPTGSAHDRTSYPHATRTASRATCSGGCRSL